MYRDKTFQVRPLEETLEDIARAGATVGEDVEKVFVADGDALVLETDHWLAILDAAKRVFPRLRRVSCYAMARNVTAKSDEELRALAKAGLSLLYIGPESGDDATLKRIAKGDDFAAHVRAAEHAHAAGMQLSVIALLGIASERSDEHAKATAELVTRMDPEFFSALTVTVTVVPETPLARLAQKGRFAVPPVRELLAELRTMVDLARPSNAVFRTNHASNYLPLAGRLPHDRVRIVGAIDDALAGRKALRAEWMRGL